MNYIFLVGVFIIIYLMNIGFKIEDILDEIRRNKRKIEDSEREIKKVSEDIKRIRKEMDV